MRIQERRQRFAILFVLILILHASVVAIAFTCIEDQRARLFACTLAVATAVVDLLAMRHLVGTLDRLGRDYSMDVTQKLEATLREYRNQAECDRRQAEAIGATVDQRIMSARSALAAGDVDVTQDELIDGINIASRAHVAPCENIVVASVLDSKSRQCAEAGVELDAKVVLPDDLGLDDVEVASVFFNLIDNALHECEELAADEARIEVRSRIQAGQLFVEVSNPCRKGAERRRQTAARQADATMFHGLGTTIVSEIAEKHGGIARFAERDGRFTADVMIPVVQLSG